MELKSIKNKKKITKRSSVLIAKKLKEIERKEKKHAKSKAAGKNTLFGRIIVCALIVVTIAATYIYIERQAEAAHDQQSHSRIMMIYEFYNSRFSSSTEKLITDVLLSKGVEETLSMQIAQTVVAESKKTNIPMQMYLAIMKTESTFRPTVVSSAYARGIMQIQPGTWDAYVKKHNLPVTREQMFEPQANILVASVILKELYDNYIALGYEEPDVWHYVLAAYFAGPASLKGGIRGYHWRYIEKVKKHYNEFETQITA